LGERGGINLYDYVRNNPVNLFDPLGLEWQFSVGFSGVLGATPIGFGLPYSFISSGESVGFTSSGQLFFQGYSAEMNGAGIFGGGGLSLGVTHTHCPTPAGKSVTEGTHTELDGGDVLEGGAAFDADDEGAGASLPFPDKLHLGVGGGFVAASGPSVTTTYETPPLSQVFQNSYFTEPTMFGD